MSQPNWFSETGIHQSCYLSTRLTEYHICTYIRVEDYCIQEFKILNPVSDTYTRVEDYCIPEFQTLNALSHTCIRVEGYCIIGFQIMDPL